jgi:hypothetical protein
MLTAQRPPGQPAELRPVHRHHGVAAVISHVPAGRRLDESLSGQRVLGDVAQLGDVRARRHPFKDDPAREFGQSSDEVQAGPSVPAGRPVVEFPVPADPDPCARRRQRARHAGGYLSSQRGIAGNVLLASRTRIRGLRSAQRAGGDAVGLPGRRHPVTGRLLAGVIPGHSASFRQGPTHPPGRQGGCTFAERRESKTLVLVTGSSVGGVPARNGQARLPLRVIVTELAAAREPAQRRGSPSAAGLTARAAASEPQRSGTRNGAAAPRRRRTREPP